MNRLKHLRTEANISMRDMYKYTHISNPVISYLENGKRTFRQAHIDTLASFFSVTADYLLGRTNYGLVVRPQFGEEEIILTDEEYGNLIDKIELSIIRVGNDILKVKINKDIVVIPKFVVYRELKGSIKDYNLQKSLETKLEELKKRMTTDELERTIKFIEDYILK